jgi:hypothetical protein
MVEEGTHEVEVTGSNPHSRGAHIFRAKNEATCDFDGASGVADRWGPPRIKKNPIFWPDFMISSGDVSFLCIYMTCILYNNLNTMVRATRHE